MLQFQPFNDFLAMVLDERAEAAAGQLVRTEGYRSMRLAIEALHNGGLIGDECAAHLALALIGDLSVDGEHLQRLERLGVGVPDALPDPGDGHALQALIGETAVQLSSADEGKTLGEFIPEDADTERGQARENRLHALEQLRAAKRRADRKSGSSHEDSARPHATSNGDDEDQRTCPICGVPLSRGAIGCRKHWRQVKKEMVAR